MPSAPAVPPGFTASATSYTNSTPVTIPTTAATVTSTINVSGAQTFLHDVDLLTGITHTWNNDLRITLTSPAGTSVTLTSGNTSPGAGIVNVYNGTLWDDDADPGNAASAYAASATPASSNLATDTVYTTNVVEATLTPEEALAAFRGENPNGDWVLTVRDVFTDDGGAINSWRLDLSTLNAAPTVAALPAYSNTSPVAIPTTIALVSSTITVSGAPTYIHKAVLQTFITHTYNSDIFITLTSPSGTSVTISSGNGGALDNLYHGTVWDDDADPGNPAGSYTTAGTLSSSNMATDAVYVNLIARTTLTPEEALGAFIGEDPNGVWTLAIQDRFNGDGGSIDQWSLIFTTDVPPFVSSVERMTPAAVATNSPTVTFRVVFSESVTGVDAGDFALTGAGASGTIIGPVTGSGSTYFVQVSTGSDGSLGLNVLDNDSILDAAGGNLSGGFTTGQTYTIDQTAPEVSSITPVGPTSTNASIVQFTVVFSESVTGIAAAGTNFSVTQSGGMGAAVTGASGSGTTYTVTVSTGSGDGTIALNFATPAGVTDAAGNTATSLTGTSVFTIDKTPPIVSSIVAVTPSPTIDNAISWTVTFSDSVTGVDLSDFTVTTSGVVGAFVASVTPVSGSVYTVTANTGTGNGFIRLDVADNDTILDGVTNPLGGPGDNGDFTTGDTIEIDRGAPQVASIVPAASPTNATSLTFTVTFTESVFNVDPADFAVSVSGLGASTVTSVSGSGLTYTVVVSVGSGDGTLTLNLVDNNTITNASGGPLGGPTMGDGNFSSAVVVIDRTPPAVTGIALVDPSPTNAGLVSFRVTYSEAVAAVDTADFVLFATGGISGATIVSVGGSGSSWVVTINTGSGSGSVGLNAVDNDSVRDIAGNTLGGTGTGAVVIGPSYQIDKTPAVVTSIARSNPSAAVVNGSTVRFVVTFSEPIGGIDVSDFNLATSGVSGASVLGVSGSGTTFFVDVNLGTGDGTVALTLADNDSIVDPVGNPLAGAGAGNGTFTSEGYTIDRTSARPATFTRLDPEIAGQSSVRYSLVFSEPVTGLTVANFSASSVGSVSGARVVSVSGSGGSYVVTVAVTPSGTGAVTLTLANGAGVADLVGNPVTGVPTQGPTYTLDFVPPRVVAINRIDPASTAGRFVSYAVTFSEAVTGLQTGQFSLITGGSVRNAAVVGLSGSGTSYVVTVDGGTGSGTLTLTMALGGPSVDRVGQPVANAGFVGETYLFNRVVSRVPRMAVAPDAGLAPFVQVIDPTSGAPLFGFMAYSPAYLGGVRIAVADVDGDGVDDVITVPGAGLAPVVQVFSGVDGGIIAAFFAFPPAYQGALNVAAVSDPFLNRTMIVVAPDVGGPPVVQVFDPSQGFAATEAFFAFAPSFLGGVTLAAGDTNNDLRPEIVTGTASGGSLVNIWGGVGRTLIGQTLGGVPSNGVRVAVADTDGSGFGKVVTAPASEGPLQVTLHDPLTGYLPSFSVALPSPSDRLPVIQGASGGVIVSATDRDRDGRAEILASVGKGRKPGTFVFDGRSLVPLAALNPFGGFLGGVFVAGDSAR